MERLTISVSDDFAAELAAFMQSRGGDNRSEAIRDLARVGLRQEKMQREVAGECVATLSYTYNHKSRDLPQRLTKTNHAHHDLQVATLHVHLDQETCLEVAVLRGPCVEVTALANAVTAERGVTHGALSVLPLTLATDPSGASQRGGTHDHRHLRT